MKKPKKHFPGAGKFDKINSTYKNVIFLTETNKVPFLEGYSKGLLHPEALDKIVLLESWILRLFNKGYLDEKKTVQIDFYLKSFLANNDQLIFTLKPNSYTIIHDKFLMNERLNQFLAKLYAQIKAGKIITKDIIHSRTLTKNDDIFPMRANLFKNEDDLRNYCIQKMKEGNEEGLVKGFFYKYKDRYLGDWKQTPLISTQKPNN